jgi:hypothetical protein
MALLPPVLEVLSASFIRNLPLITSMVEAGESSTAITDALQRLGQGVRRQDLLEGIRALKGIQESGDYLSSVRNDRRPDPSRLPPPITSTLRSFSFNVRVDGILEETGERASQYVTVSTSELKTIAELKAAALNMIPNMAEGIQGSGHLEGMDEATAVVESGTFSG